jgi:hypothetical protein
MPRRAGDVIASRTMASGVNVANPHMRVVVCLCLLAASFLAPGLFAAEPFISEFMPDNARVLADQDGHFSDWIEIHNPGDSAINLAGYYLTDDPQLLTKWRFPSVTLSAGGYLVVFASGKDRTSDPPRLHTSFQLNASGGYLALVRPDGATIVSSFPVYPNVPEDVSFGTAQSVITTELLANSPPRILVPAGAAELPANWAQPGFVPGANWFTGSAPLAIGFDTNQPPPVPSNLAPGGVALQSTTFGNFSANLAANNNLADHTQTLNTDNAPFWQVTLARETAVHRIVLRNRTSCCGSRLRDITVEVLGPNGLTNFASALLNPENTGSTYPAGPASLTVDLVGLTGNPVFGSIVRVHRAPDPDLSGTGGQGTVDEAAVLSLGEVEVIGVPALTASPEVNLARTGSPAPVAAQSSTSGGFVANLAIDGNTGNFTHTIGADTNATWTLNLGRRALIRSVTLHNRDACCGSRLRDITVQVLASDSNTVLYTSALLNPENTGFTYPNGPDNIVLDLSTNSVLGQYIRVRRAPDPDLSGTGGQGNADEANVLSLGEVIVLGVDLNGYRPFVRTDMQSRMLGVNASAFVRVPITVADPPSLASLALRLRYDDGFIAYLNGTEIALRNAPGSPAWNSSATANRDLAAGINPETFDLTPFISSLNPGANTLAFHALNSSASDGDFLLQAELTSTRLQITPNVFLTSPTPGARNETDWYFAEVDDTQFSVNRGFFDAPFALTISSATPDALIYYSVNGDEPGPGKGFLYTGPILITNTTVLRSRAFRENWKPTDIDTHTYIFVADVIQQAKHWPTPRVPPPYFPASWGNNSVDYGMDPQIVTNYPLAEWKEILSQVPTMSIVTEMGNLFDPATGIYANALQHGIDWERPMSLELIDPNSDNPSRFQENCGVRIRGGFSRNPQFVKHSLRVFFRREYGAGRLAYPLFENDGAQEFETFDLRTSQNYSWPREGSFENGRFDTMVREVFCRETLGAMGQPYRRSRYYHLYINGQYWGLYETDERPEASYGESYFGGSKENFDVVKCGNRGTQPNFATEATDGNLLAFSNLWTMTRSMVTNSSNSNYFRIIGCNPDGTRNTNRPVMIDVDNLIDYILGIFYTGDGDATLSSFLANNMPNNWFGMRDRTNPNVGFRFFNSDCEHTLGSPDSEVDRTGPFPGSNQSNFTFANPQWMHEELMLNAEYRLRFADHVQRHFFNNGALTLEAVTNRFLRKASQITKAMIAYSARWGDAVREPPYNTNDWHGALAFVVNTWFPARPAILLAQLRADSLWPAIAAPVFSQLGGDVPEGYALEMLHTNAAGAIFFTLDGSDPRAVSGGVAASAQSYSGAIIVNAPTTVRARVLTGSNWSPILEYTFFPPQDLSKLLITEIMYHPPSIGAVDSDEFEFVELKNTGTTTLNLSGLRFTGINFVFTNGTRLTRGQFFVLARNAAQFVAKYPSVAVGGIYGGRLDNGGETLTLSHPLGARVLSVNYDDLAPWPVTPDDFGFSLVPVQPNSNPDPDNAANWRASTLPGGSPGADDPATSVPPALINEVLSHSETGVDFIELFNPDRTNAVDIGGWFLTDDPGTPMKYRIVGGTFIAPLSSLVFTEAQFNPTPGVGNSFSLSARGDDVYLFSGDANTNLTGYSHGFTFGAAPDGGAFGRYVISTGDEHFPGQLAATPGDPNSGPRTGPVVINEIMYHPDIGGDEFVELKNITTNAVQLFDPAFPTNAWKVAGVDFTFPTNLTLPPNGFALLVATNPATFRARYSISVAIPIFGPISGVLQDSGERLELQRPDVPDTNGTPYITVDEVRYNDKAPWPAAADGSGPSLQRRSSVAYGNDPANWEAAVATPGADFLGGQSPSIATQPQSQSIIAGDNVAFSVTANGVAPLNYQWRFQGDPIPGATSPILALTNVQSVHAGAYSVVVFNNSGSIASAIAHLTVRRPPAIALQPANQFPRPGSNAVFSVSATGNGFLRYQWRYNGVNISGATNFSFVVTNAQFSNEGTYSVVVTDSVTSIASVGARLLIAIDPVITQHPLSQSVVAGGSVVLSIAVTNTATLPVYYRLRSNNITLNNTLLALNQRSAFYTLTNVRTNATNWSIVVTNAARPAGVLSATAQLFILADTDADGVPDAWESQFGLNPGDPADRTADTDGDTMLNWQEYVAGTDPTNALSYLKLDLTGVAGGAALEFFAISNITYAVEFNDTLRPGEWFRLADVPAGASNRLHSLIDSNATPRRTYRLVTPRPQ